MTDSGPAASAPLDTETEIRMMLRAWDNDAGRLSRADVESLAEWIAIHDYRRIRRDSLGGDPK